MEARKIALILIAAFTEAAANLEEAIAEDGDEAGKGPKAKTSTRKGKTRTDDDDADDKDDDKDDDDDGDEPEAAEVHKVARAALAAGIERDEVKKIIKKYGKADTAKEVQGPSRKKVIDMLEKAIDAV